MEVVDVRPSAVEAVGVSRSFGRVRALVDLSLRVEAGAVHALLGPNGAGKTTLLRVLTGLVHPDGGRVRVVGLDPTMNPRELRERIGLVPSGDRSLYLRISGLENLVFFARLYGLRRRQAVARANEALARVGLAEAARLSVGTYSHGMQKRLLFARALLSDPQVLLVDEATHDLDPEGARTVRELALDAVDRGAAVLWATQRIDEIKGFADRVTLLDRGIERFTGTVPALMAHAFPRRYVVQLRNGNLTGGALERALGRQLAGLATLRGVGEEDGHYVLSLSDNAILGDALTAIARADVQLLTCREERSEIEEAFLALTGGGAS
jgi:ABC-2 type transport system ATP-binding protein